MTGVFESWDECKKQIHEFPQAEYKSFKTKQLAEEAFRNNSNDFIGKDFFEATLTEDQLKLLVSPILESTSVDGAWEHINRRC